MGTAAWHGLKTCAPRFRSTFYSVHTSVAPLCLPLRTWKVWVMRSRRRTHSNRASSARASVAMCITSACEHTQQWQHQRLMGLRCAHARRLASCRAGSEMRTGSIAAAGVGLAGGIQRRQSRPTPRARESTHLLPGRRELVGPAPPAGQAGPSRRQSGDTCKRTAVGWVRSRGRVGEVTAAAVGQQPAPLQACAEKTYNLRKVKSSRPSPTRS